MNSSQLAISRSEVELFTPQPSTPLVVLLELGDQRRKVAVARQQGEHVDVLLGIAQVHGVDHHADVGAVLAAHLALRNVDQFDPLGVELADGVLVVAPVAIGPLVDDAAFFQQPLEDQLDLELARPSCRGRRWPGSRNRQRRQSAVRRTCVPGGWGFCRWIASPGPPCGLPRRGTIHEIELSTCAAKHNLKPARPVAVDALFTPGRRANRFLLDQLLRG